MEKNIQKILIANRGEIACRVIRTCRRLGIQTVSVFSEADKKALHVQMADEAIYIGAAAASESYLVIERIISAAKQARADAIHPGYGFLSENPDFAEACAEADIIFIGPKPASMRDMALKDAAKELVSKDNVPIAPGYFGEDQSQKTLLKAAEEIGYPLLIKAVAGGGGKGMRKVFSSTELPEALIAAKREGLSAFGNDRLLLEKYIEKPRHIEVQVFGDSHSNIVHLSERDCSIQRRYQKVIEEAPAPGMSAEKRQEFGEAAVRAAKAVNYIGAGTVEFIVDASVPLEDAPFYFMEMNTRLQVEHPVTEMITGQDLVEWQIRVAQGEALPLTQAQIDASLHGHAIEARLYAEDPVKNFMPATGTVKLFDPLLPLPDHSRIDAAVCAGDEVSIYYDPMIAKLIAYGENRAQAIQRLTSLLAETPITGLPTNRDFLVSILHQKAFNNGDVHTGFIEEHQDSLINKQAMTSEHYALAALGLILNRKASSIGVDPWAQTSAFRLNLPAAEKISFLCPEDNNVQVTACHGKNHILLTVGDQIFNASDDRLANNTLICLWNSNKLSLHIDITDEAITLVSASETIRLHRELPATAFEETIEGAGTVLAPMAGKIIQIFGQNGQTVKQGQPLLVLEAMKMEHTITAPKSGIISDLNLKEQQQVSESALLLRISTSDQEVK